MSEHNARRWNVSNDEYHAEHGVYGNSMLSCFRESPILFHGRFITGEIPPRERTPALTFGSNFDRFLLENETVVEIPTNVLSKSGSKAGNAWKEWAAEHEGQLTLKTAEYDIFQRMADNIRSHKDASQLIQGLPQVAIRWEDEATSLPLKARFDVFGDGRLVDLKTSADPTPRMFATSIEKFGYYRQAALYSHAVALLTGRPHEWFFVVIRNVAPWDVATYQITDEWKARGGDEVRETINALSSAIAADKWEPAGYGSTLELSPPRWTEYVDDYQQTGEQSDEH
jgi:hypothetical protein